MAAQSVPRVELMNRHGSGIEPATFHLSQDSRKNKICLIQLEGCGARLSYHKTSLG